MPTCAATGKQDLHAEAAEHRITRRRTRRPFSRWLNLVKIGKDSFRALPDLGSRFRYQGRQKRLPSPGAWRTGQEPG